MKKFTWTCITICLCAMATTSVAQLSQPDEGQLSDLYSGKPY